MIGMAMQRIMGKIFQSMKITSTKIYCAEITLSISQNIFTRYVGKKVNAGLLSFSRVGLFGRFKRNTVMT